MSDRIPAVGQSRGVRAAPYTVLTPANRYPSRLPNLRDALLYKLVTPRLAPARFALCIVAAERGGGTSAPVAAGFESFLYVLRGAFSLSAEGLDQRLVPGSWCYLPADVAFGFEAAGEHPAELLWVKRRYESWAGLEAPGALCGHREDGPFADDPNVPGLRRRELLYPTDPRHDFNISLLAFDPGVGLDKVEIHDEEHGLYMTAGAGIYHLDGAEHEVGEDDFIYMAPYCPQSFVATGDGVAEYLLYKDVYRDGF